MPDVQVAEAVALIKGQHLYQRDAVRGGEPAIAEAGKIRDICDVISGCKLLCVFFYLLPTRETMQ